MTQEVVKAGGGNKSVTTQHKDYDRMLPKWKRCRDAAGGQDAIRAGGMSYLPKLTDQSQEAYAAYLMRATFFNATWRTICGLVGMLFRKPEVVEAPDSIKKHLEDVTMGGEPLHVFVQELAEECFKVGRVGLMVDYPALNVENKLTIAQAEALGLRPTMQRYAAETIINWRVGLVNNVSKLLMVVLTEEFYIRGDEFSGKCETRYRVLDLIQDPKNPAQMAYRVRVFRVNEKSDSQEQIGEDSFPLMAGKPLQEIPFFFLGTDSITPEVDIPPLIDLVDLNIAHFRVSADYEHGCHFSGLPQMVVSGYVPDSTSDKLYIGGASAWTFPDPAAHASYVEVNGNFAALENNLNRKEEQMVALGARLLASDKRINETATTAAIHHGGETSILSAVAQVLSLGVTKALGVFSQWAGVTAPVKFEINRDFFPVPMDAPTLQALVSAWQSGAISQETLFQNLQEGEIISSDTDFEKESAKIANAPPTSTRMATNKVSDNAKAA
jgi:hypothetical protein